MPDSLRDNLKNLLALLEQEQGAVVDNDAAALEGIAARKARLLDTINAQSRDIEGPLPPDLRQLLTELQRKNSVNGTVIGQQLRWTQQALDLLRGQSTTYDRAGRAAAASLSRLRSLG